MSSSATPPLQPDEVTKVLSQFGPGTNLTDPDVEEVAAGLSPAARSTLTSLLGELFTVLDNMDTFCDQGVPVYTPSAGFGKLRQLLTVLNRS
jgi:hypothetical protein